MSEPHDPNVTADLPSAPSDSLRAADPLGTEVEPQPAREEPVAVRVLDHVVGRDVAHPEDPLHAFRPDLQIAARVAGHHGLPGRTARHVEPHQLLVGDREQARGVVVAEVVLTVKGTSASWSREVSGWAGSRFR